MGLLHPPAAVPGGPSPSPHSAPSQVAGACEEGGLRRVPATHLTSVPPETKLSPGSDTRAFSAGRLWAPLCPGGQLRADTPWDDSSSTVRTSQGPPSPSLTGVGTRAKATLSLQLPSPEERRPGGGLIPRLLHLGPQSRAGLCGHLGPVAAPVVWAHACSGHILSVLTPQRCQDTPICEQPWRPFLRGPELSAETEARSGLASAEVCSGRSLMPQTA